MKRAEDSSALYGSVSLHVSQSLSHSAIPLLLVSSLTSAMVRYLKMIQLRFTNLEHVTRTLGKGKEKNVVDYKVSI